MTFRRFHFRPAQPANSELQTALNTPTLCDGRFCPWATRAVRYAIPQLCWTATIAAQAFAEIFMRLIHGPTPT